MLSHMKINTIARKGGIVATGAALLLGITGAGVAVADSSACDGKPAGCYWQEHIQGDYFPYVNGYPTPVNWTKATINAQAYISANDTYKPSTGKGVQCFIQSNYAGVDWSGDRIVGSIAITVVNCTKY